MPEGVKGFQPGRPKTGGRKKESAQRVKPFIDMLKDNGFNYAKELANALHDLPVTSSPVSTKYSELMRLLPYMAPRLNEREVDIVDPATEQQAQSAPISDETLMKVLEHGKPKQPGSNRGGVEKRNPVVEVPRRPDPDLQDLAREQAED